MGRVAAAFFLGFAVAAVVLLIFADSRRTESVPPHEFISQRAETPAVAPPPTAADRTAIPEPPPPEPVRRDTAEESGDPRFSAALLGFARVEIEAGWKESRTDEPTPELLTNGLTEFQATTLKLPRDIGRRLAEQLSTIERIAGALDSSDGITLLTALDELGLQPSADVVTDATRFADLVAPRTNRGFADGVRHLKRLDDAVDEGVTIQFPAGVFEIGSGFMGTKTPFPKEVTIVGAGMDATLLVAREFGTRGPLERFTLRDATFYNPSGGLLDQRSNAATVMLERVRVIGFDCGAGGSDAFNSAALALLCRDCRIEGGYGRHPQGYSNLFDVRTPALMARFERCVLSRLSLANFDQRHAIAFVDCELADIYGGLGAASDQYPGISFEGCSIRMWPADGIRTQLDLDTLFPDWESRRVR